jgi:hypothetical protein
MKSPRVLVFLSLVTGCSLQGSGTTQQEAQRVPDNTTVDDPGEGDDQGEGPSSNDDAGTGDTGTPGTDSGSTDTGTTDGGSDVGSGSSCLAASSGWRAMKSEATVGSGTAWFVDQLDYLYPWTNPAQSAVWTGKEMFALGSNEGTPEAAAYNPSTDTWRLLKAPPGYRTSSFWTGDKWIVFGPHESYGTGGIDGYIYDPTSDTWSVIPKAPLSNRINPAMVYATTTHELIVWGGSQGIPAYADGAAYSLTTGTWRILSAAPISGRTDMGFAWDGTRMVIAGGGSWAWVEDVTHETPFDDGATYDPATDTWKSLGTLPFAKRVVPVSASTGGDVFFYSGEPRRSDEGGELPFADGLMLRGDAWTAISDPMLASVTRDGGKDRFGFAFAAGDHKLFISSGMADGPTGIETFSDGAYWDANTKTWTKMDGGPQVYGALAVWTGCDFIVFGGATKAGGTVEGKLFRP